MNNNKSTREYNKISKNDVFRMLTNTALNISPLDGLISIKEIAYYLNTSRYQVKKYINELKAEELVILSYYTFTGEDIDEPTPPYWGYKLTAKGREREYFKEVRKKEMEIINEIFN